MALLTAPLRILKSIWPPYLHLVSRKPAGLRNGEPATDGDSRNPRRRRLPPPRRGIVLAALAAVVSTASFFVLAVPVWRSDVAGWDEALSERIRVYENRDTALDRVDVFSIVLSLRVQALGLLVVLAAAAILAFRGRSRPGLFLVLGVVGAAVLTVVLKDVFERPPVDPDGSGYSFPSGHALRSGAAALALAVVAWPTRARWPVAAVAALVAATVGVAVVYHEWHWASDTLAGWSVAVAWVAIVWLLLRPSTGQRASVAQRRNASRSRGRASPREAVEHSRSG